MENLTNTKYVTNHLCYINNSIQSKEGAKTHSMINIHKHRSRKEQQILMNTTEKVELALLILRYVYTGQFSKRGVFRSLGSALCQSGPRQHKWKTTTSELFWGGSARSRNRISRDFSLAAGYKPAAFLQLRFPPNNSKQLWLHLKRRYRCLRSAG